MRGEGLYEIFRDPENKYRPFVRWWWNGDRVVPEELLRELDVMKAAGIGGVEINPIRFPGEADDMGVPVLSYLSDEWLDVLEATLKGARALVAKPAQNGSDLLAVRLAGTSPAADEAEIVVVSCAR